MCRSSTAAWCPSGLIWGNMGEEGSERDQKWMVGKDRSFGISCFEQCPFNPSSLTILLVSSSFWLPTSPLVSVEGPTPFTILQDLDTDIGFSVFSSVCFPTSVMHSGSYFANLVPGHLVGWLEGIVLLAQFCWLTCMRWLTMIFRSTKLCSLAAAPHCFPRRVASADLWRRWQQVPFETGKDDVCNVCQLSPLWCWIHARWYFRILGLPGTNCGWYPHQSTHGKVLACSIR